MNKKQSGILSMLRRMLDFLVKYAAMVSGLPSFPGLQTRFETYLTEIISLTEKQEKDISGLATQKITLRGALTQKAMDACRRMVAYAKINGDEVMAQVASYKEYDLSKMSDNLFLSTCSTIYTAAENAKEVLTDYGVTTETQVDFKGAISAFAAVIDAPKEGYIEKKQITSRLAELFDLELDLLAKMDVLVDMLKDSQPAFYAEYQDTRKVVISGTGSLQVQGTVSDSITNQPIVDATVTFKNNETDEVVMVKQTAEKGGINIKSMDEGVYKMVVSKVGFQTLEDSLTVDSTLLSGFSVKLVKA